MLRCSQWPTSGLRKPLWVKVANVLPGLLVVLNEDVDGYHRSVMGPQMNFIRNKMI